MKSLISVALFSIISASSALAGGIGPAKAQQLVCSSTPTQFGAVLSIVVPAHDDYTAVIKGSQSGGIAHYIRLIGPYNVKISYEADGVLFSNSEEGIELDVVTTTIGGHLITTASFTEGNTPAVSLNCHIENI
jgi:hypothetical protein